MFLLPKLFLFVLSFLLNNNIECSEELFENITSFRFYLTVGSRFAAARP